MAVVAARKCIQPTVLIGLGGRGAEIAWTTSEVFAQLESDLVKVVSCLTLDAGGMVRETAVGEALFTCSGLEPDLAPGNFARNFRAVLGHEKDFEDVMASRIEAVRKIETLVELQEKGYRIDDNVNLLLISTLFDPVGSAAIIPFLGFVQTLFAGRLRGIGVTTDVLAFFPDLFEDSKVNELAYSRSYACLQELDFIAEHPETISPEGQPPFHLAWLVTGKNEDGAEIGSYTNLVPLVGEVFSSLITRKIASDTSFSAALLRKVDGKRARYSSFGLVRLVFPRDAVMEGFSHYLGFRILDREGIETSLIFDHSYIAADVKDFLLTHRLDRLLVELETDTEGRSIWTDFRYHRRMNEDLAATILMRELDGDAEDFERSDVTAMTRKLVLKREWLFQDRSEKVLGFVKTGIDAKDKGLAYARAFLDVMQGQESAYTRGEWAESDYTVALIERQAKAYFDRLLDIDRKRLQRLKQDLADKKALRARLTEEVQKGAVPVPLPGTDAARPEEKLAVVEGELATLQAEYDDLAMKAMQADLLIADPVKRRDLLVRVQDGIQQEIGELKSRFQEADATYQELKSRLADLYEKRKQVALRLFVTHPALLVLAFALVLVGARSFLDVPVLTLARVTARMLPVLLATYSVWALVVYWSGIRKEILQGEERLGTAKLEKVRVFLELQAAYNRFFRAGFDPALHSGLVEWAADFSRFVGDLGDKVTRFLAALAEYKTTSKARWNGFAPPSTLFVRSAVTKDDLVRFTQETPRVQVEIDGFFKEMPLSAYFSDFLAAGTIDALTAQIRSRTEEAFKPIREKSLERFLQEEEAEGRLNVAEKLYNLYTFAKAFILLDVEKGMDVSQPVTYLGVGNPDTSYVRETFRKHAFAEVQTYSVGNDDEVVITKLKVGFPALHVALTKYGERAAAKHTDGMSLYVNPEWRPEDLLPAVYTLGDAENPVRRLACLARAFGLLVEREGKFHLGDQEIGTTYQDVVEYLRAFSHSDVRARLENLVEVEKRKEDAADRLIEYQNLASLDRIDRKIVEETIEGLSPLA